jgi:hypothetical protein
MPPLGHARQKPQGEIDRTFDIEIDESELRCAVKPDGRAMKARTGIVDKDIDVAPAKCANKALDAGAGREIRDNEMGPGATCVLDPVGSCRQPV